MPRVADPPDRVLTRGFLNGTRSGPFVPERGCPMALGERVVEQQMQPDPAQWDVHRKVVAWAWIVLGAVGGVTTLGMFGEFIELADVRSYGPASGGVELFLVPLGLLMLAIGAMLFLALFAGVVGGVGLLLERSWSKWVLGPCAVLWALGSLPTVVLPVFCGYTVWVLLKVFPQPVG